MKKYVLFVFVLVAIAAFLGCHAGGNAPFINVSSESNLVSFEREVDENGRFADITFPSGAVIKCTQDGTLKKGTKITATEQKVTNNANSGDGTSAYIYNITGNLYTDDMLKTAVSVNTLEKPISVTLPNNSTSGTCYIGTRASENEPWRYSLATDGMTDIRFVRLQASTPSQCNFNLYRLGINFALFVLNNQSKDEAKIDSITVPTENKVTVMDGCYGEEIYIKVAVIGEKLGNIKPDGVIARITYRSEKETPDEIKANGSIVKQTNLSDKAVSGGYEHSFEVTNLTIDSNAGEIALSFVLNLNGVSLDVFPTDFLLEFYSKGDAVDTLPFNYTLPFSYEKVEKQEEPEPEPELDYYTLTLNCGTGINTVEGKGNYKTDEKITLNYTLKEGYEFDKWVDSEGNAVTSPFTMPAKAVTLTANAKVITYNITYNLDNGQLTKDNPENYRVETEDITLTNPTKDGYTFKGWSGTDLTGDSNQEVTIAKGSTGARSYTANFVENYNITYDLADGSLPQGTTNPATYSVLSDDITLNNPTRDGYTFKGWSGTDLTGDSNQEVTIAKGSTGARSYTANFVENYNITYDWAGGSLPQGTTNPATYSVLSDDITLNNPTRDGVYFMGWTCDEYFGASMTVKIPQGSTGNKTYTANWGEILIFNLPNDVTLVMHKIPARTFTMGSPEGEAGRQNDETQHSVTISKDYWMGTYEVTQAQYKAIMGSNPSYFKSSNGFSDEDQRPVESVSWDDIMTDSTGFIARINTQLASQLPNGYKFDLPTEAQWEYACRAGTLTSLNNGTNVENPSSEDTNLNAVAWNSYNSAVENIKQPHTVGGKTPNAWGLYDMHGNVYEWCKDMHADYPTGAVTDPFCNSGSERVMRGGGFNFNPKICRSASRIICNPSEGGSIQGFRLALVKE